MSIIISIQNKFSFPFFEALWYKTVPYFESMYDYYKYTQKIVFILYTITGKICENTRK